MRKPKLLEYVLSKTAVLFLTRLHRLTHRMPIRVRPIERQRVLVVAPHSDDEVISAGGTLALHQSAGSVVQVLYVTSDANAPAESIAARRMVEAKRVSSMLGFELAFLGYPDGSVSLHEPRLARDIGQHIARFKPDVLLVPFPGDHHRDHQATSAACTRAVAESDFQGEVWCYEIWSTIWPNCAVDIARVVDKKREAINTYVSQTDGMPYADAALGLNRYRGLKVQAEHAEAFFVCSKKEFAALGKTLYSIAPSEMRDV